MTSIQRTSLPLAAGALAALALLTGCSAPTLPGDLGRLQQAAAACPEDRKVATFIADDRTGSSSNDTIQHDRLEVIERAVTRTLLCGGHVRIVAFADSSGGNAVLFDEELEALPGATDTSRIRHAEKVLEELLPRVEEAFTGYQPKLSQRGSDILGELRLAAEYGQSLGDYQLDAYVLTDGLQNVGISLDAAALSGDEAARLAEDVPVPDLSGAQLSFIGLGQTSGEPPASWQIEGLVAFYSALCERTGAGACTAVTAVPKGA